MLDVTLKVVDKIKDENATYHRESPAAKIKMQDENHLKGDKPCDGCMYLDYDWIQKVQDRQEIAGETSSEMCLNRNDDDDPITVRE